MKQKHAIQILLLSVLIFLFTSYIVRIILLPNSLFKNVEIGLIFFSVVFFFVNRLKATALIIFSIAMLLFELNATIKVPFTIHLLEATIKILSPIIFLLILRKNALAEIVAKISIALTYTAHGILAANIITTPENFYLMTQKILGFNQLQASVFLKVVGWIDIFACILLLFFKGKITKAALYYCVFWGFVTALARTFYVYDSLLPKIIITFLTETIVRFPNSLIPLLLLLLIKKNEFKKL